MAVSIIERPHLPKNEDDFIRYQKEYVLYLKKLIAAQKSGQAEEQISDERQRITHNWIQAGILDEGGNVTEPYRRLFPNE